MKKKHDPVFEDYVSLLIRFFTAVKTLDPEGWVDASGTFYKARVLRALLRVLTDMTLQSKSLNALTVEHLLRHLKKVDPNTLSEDRLRAAQGSAGVTDLYTEMKAQIFPS